MRRLGTNAPQFVPEQLENFHKLQYFSWLTKLKAMAKSETDRLLADLAQKAERAKAKKVDRLSVKDVEGLSPEPFEVVSTLPSLTQILKGKGAKVMRNPFDIGRAQLLDQLAKMRSYFMNPVRNDSIGNEDLKHNVSIASMGDYHAVLQSRETLRPLNEDDKADQGPLFGNPFRQLGKGKQKRNAMSVDEADEYEDFGQAKRMMIEAGPASPVSDSLDSDSEVSVVSSSNSAATAEEQSQINQQSAVIEGAINTAPQRHEQMEPLLTSSTSTATSFLSPPIPLQFLHHLRLLLPELLLELFQPTL